jgi:hypothetical protein
MWVRLSAGNAAGQVYLDSDVGCLAVMLGSGTSHALGPTPSFQAMESPRHKVQISENVARMFRNESLRELREDPGDDHFAP